MEGHLAVWWKKAKKRIEAFLGSNRVAEFRREEIEVFKNAFGDLSVLDEFQKAGVFVNWWEAVKYDLKTIVATGWSPTLIPDEYIKSAFFKDELAQIEAIETNIAEIESALSELLDEVEIESDEEGEESEKTPKVCKDYLRTEISNLLKIPSSERWNERKVKALIDGKEAFDDAALTASTIKDLSGFWNSLETTEKKEKELRGARKKQKEAEKELLEKIEAKKLEFTEAQAKELILQKLFDGIVAQLHRYLNAQKKAVASIFEKLWDKYKVSLTEIDKERDAAVNKLNGFLQKLNYKGV